MYCCVSVSPVDGYLGYFQFLTIMNNADMNIKCKSFCGHKILFALGRYLRVELLRCMVSVYLTF